ncbi:chloride channel protein [Sinomicrobium sp. M5D2P9]
MLSVKTKSLLLFFWNALLVAVLSVLLAFTLKYLTETAEEFILELATAYTVGLFLFPFAGLILIYYLRKWIFKGKKNKGIKEIYNTLSHRKESLPWYKIPSHYINGFLTVISGGSTGIEVSTVVATAAVGANMQRTGKSAKKHRSALICAGVAAGIATLFSSPLAGGLFALEVIARKRDRFIWIAVGMGSAVAGGVMYLEGQEYLFDAEILFWKWQAMPYFIVVSLLSGICAVYFTKTVLFFKERLGNLENNLMRIGIGALLLGGFLYMFPQLYGDSYHAIPEFLTMSSEMTDMSYTIPVLLLLILFKPLAASLTLGGGGDGGVFAPSIVTGAFIGLFVALVGNQYFGMELVPVNFALIGAATMLSAAIHAPLTALFLACSIVKGGYVLFGPMLVTVYLAKHTAKYLYGYTVYTYQKA